jgi:8-amino-7-oxononanoate synthase
VGAREIGFEVDSHGFFPIVSVVVGSVESAIIACKILWKYGLLITPGIYPAVPYNRSILRFSITAANTEVEIDQALTALRAIYAENPPPASTSDSENSVEILNNESIKQEILL